MQPVLGRQPWVGGDPGPQRRRAGRDGRPAPVPVEDPDAAADEQPRILRQPDGGGPLALRAQLVGRERLPDGPLAQQEAQVSRRRPVGGGRRCGACHAKQQVGAMYGRDLIIRLRGDWNSQN
eukprot:scaffold161950_cov31-Prasinocladus_malaysianus.AAC.2